jgi:hypothetical protein
MRRYRLFAATTFLLFGAVVWGAEQIPAPGTKLPAAANKNITHTDCSADKIGADIPVSAIGLPVSSVTLTGFSWNAANGVAYCCVDGSMAPVDTVRRQGRYFLRLRSRLPGAIARRRWAAAA